MKKVLIFPAPFLIKAPTVDKQNDYLFSLLRDEMAMEGIGDFIEVNALNKENYCEEVRRIIAERKPDWVIAAGESATACIGLHGIKKMLVNPIVTFDDLNNMSPNIPVSTPTVSLAHYRSSRKATNYFNPSTRMWLGISMCLI